MRRVRRSMVWAIVVTGLVLVAATLVSIALGRPVPAYPAWTAITAYALPLLLIGGLVCARRPQERLGRLVLAQGIAASVMLATGEYATFSVLGRSGRLPLTGAAAWVSSVTQAALVTSLIALVLVFPTGRLLSRRWRPVAWAVAADLALGVGVSGFGGPKFNSNIDFIRNPLAFQPPPILLGLVRAGTAVVALSLFGVLAHLVVRYRRSVGDEREQLKWFVSASVFAPLLIFVPTIFFPGAMNGVLGNVAWTIGPLGIILAVGVAILRYRLYDIDVVINRAVVYGLLAAFITAVYVAIVVGVGAAIGQGSSPNLALSILATAVVAVAFQPVRVRVQRLANRLVYGRRSTPYEVLSSFSDRIASGVTGEETLTRMARTLADGTGAEAVHVWVAHGNELRPTAWWPTDAPAQTVVHRNDEAEALPIPGTLALPVRHHGVLLGAFSLQTRAGERLRPAEEQLVRDLASQAGLVLHNARLMDELRSRLEELRASRRRLVAAQDAARRRLERDIHDGAQQQLVALSVKTNLARQLVGRSPEKAEELLRSLRSDVERTLGDLAELARGMIPAALTELGLVGSLRAQAERAALPVAVHAPSDLPPARTEAEVAVYFCVLEALQNVAKYAEATRAEVRLHRSGAWLSFAVEDDGRGFDPSATSYGTGMRGMADRLAAVGGALRVSSRPGAGTTVSGRVPHAPREAPDVAGDPVPSFTGRHAMGATR